MRVIHLIFCMAVLLAGCVSTVPASMELDGRYTKWYPIGGMELVIDGMNYNLKEHLHLEYYETSGTLKYLNGVLIIGPNDIYKEARKFRPVVIGKQEYLLSDYRFEGFKKKGLGKNKYVFKKDH